MRKYKLYFDGKELDDEFDFESDAVSYAMFLCLDARRAYIERMKEDTDSRKPEKYEDPEYIIIEYDE